MGVFFFLSLRGSLFLFVAFYFVVSFLSKRCIRPNVLPRSNVMCYRSGGEPAYVGDLYDSEAAEEEEAEA